MEDKITELRMKIQELHSGLIILQQAVQNDSYPAENENIDDYLEILIRQSDKIKNEYELLTENII